MIEKENKEENKQTVCVYLPTETIKEFNHFLVEKYGNPYGKFGKTVNEALKLYLEKNKNQKAEK